MSFDPSAAASADSGIFGLPFDRASSRIILLPVPFDATASYGGGTADGPSAILKASHQVDLLDHRFGNIYEQGIFMLDIEDSLRTLNAETRKLALPIIERGSPRKKDAKDLERIELAGEHVRARTREHARQICAEGKIPGIVGGDHSTPLGQIESLAELHPGMGILQIDAHMDFRQAFEGFRYSHASIMWNVMQEAAEVSRIVQVGIRDTCIEEREYAATLGDRCRTYYDDDLADRLATGTPFLDIAREIVESLPQNVYISFDIDGLDPSLCVHTGTPVPGGLTFRELGVLLQVLRNSGKRIVGFDLVEVATTKRDDFNANVGARVLYRLCGVAAPR
ncbi:MAG: agmatinase family protein [Phycisphaeraceae bacterium]|nr:agmatinase family protein [Phycisphaeraceae bacterium]MCW5753635.1 agmatinase family protein [Phycisphaeraceae bacterium]